MVLTETEFLTGWGFIAAAGLLSAVLLWHLVARRGKVRALRRECADLVELLERDDLTCARSRRYMRKVFRDEPQSGANALVFIDIDAFKSVNDGYGHKAGDALLRSIATALVGAARDNEVVFRVGGDEFGVYVRNADLATATRRADAFRDVVSNVAISVDGVMLRRGASLGVARIEAGQDFVGALYYADEAQYAAKRSGGNAVRANEGETLRSMIARRTGPRAEELARAISSNEVTYHVQPIFDTCANQAIGVEALIRWQRPDGRMLMPAQFLDMMTGCHHADVRPPLARAKQVAATFTSGPRDIFCAFNISSGLLETPVGDEEGWIDALLAGLNPRRTVFEIVERAVIPDAERTKAVLGMLRAQGVRIALDDFGTGLSNLERFHDLDVDIVKIDRRFVRGIDRKDADTGILRALLEMSQDLSFEIIAEGVENQAALDRLNDIGIWNVQGYFLGRPAPAEDWAERLGLRSDPAPLRVVT